MNRGESRGEERIAMLDLNLNVASADLSSNSMEMTREQFLQLLGKKNYSNNYQVDSCGSFDSSIVNADTVGDDYSSSSSDLNGPTYAFSILKNREECDATNDRTFRESFGRENESVWNRTVQFFPVNAEVSGDRRGESTVVTRRKEWLDLTCKEVDYGGPTEQRIASQLKQPMKKSRRGPRSKSSQYRGVTYYRRTGRWESHIW